MSNLLKSDFHKSLARLESMVKAQGATQVHHTSSDSDPGQWAGTNTHDDQDEHGGDINIDVNGTDYNGVKKVLAMKVEKSLALSPAEVHVVKGNAKEARLIIAEKVRKGDSLTSVESWVVNGGYKQIPKSSEEGEAKDPNSVPDSHAGANIDDDEIEQDAKKSFQKSVNKSQNLSKGIEMSPILAEFARATGEGFSSLNASIQKSLQLIVDRISAVETNVSKHIGEQGEFNKGFAETMVGIGQHVAGNSELNMMQAQLPVGAPKSQFRNTQIRAVQKSFSPGGLDMSNDALSKSQITGAMTDLVLKGKLNHLDVIKYEMTGEISPGTQQVLNSYVNNISQ